MHLNPVDLQTAAPVELQDITERVRQSVAASGVTEGLCYVFSPHTTAGLTVNENADPDVKRDMIYALDRIVPKRDPNYRHAEGNSAAHVKASMMGFHAVVPISEGRLILGTWQGIYFCEFDGPRRRQVIVTVVPVSGQEG